MQGYQLVVATISKKDQGPVIVAALRPNGTFVPHVIAPADNTLTSYRDSILAAFPPAEYGGCSAVLLACPHELLRDAEWNSTIGLTSMLFSVASAMAAFWHAPIRKFLVSPHRMPDYAPGTNPLVPASRALGKVISVYNTLGDEDINTCDHYRNSKNTQLADSLPLKVFDDVTGQVLDPYRPGDLATIVRANIDQAILDRSAEARFEASMREPRLTTAGKSKTVNRGGK